MMKPQRGFPLRGPNTGSTGAAVKPGLSPAQASWPGRPLPCAGLLSVCGVERGWRASSSSCQRACHSPGQGLLPPQLPQNGVGKGAGSEQPVRRWAPAAPPC